MPNWLTTEVRIAGPDREIACFRAAHICEDEDGKDMLEFNSIIPMPPQLKGTECGGSSDVLIWALGGELYGPHNLLRKAGLNAADDTPLDFPWIRNLGITTRDELLRWAEKERADELEAARRLLEMERAIGYRSWYDWQVENWGCKWGCCEFMWLTDDKTAFLFDTPWSPPVPIFHKLVAMYPSLTFTCHFLEEAMDIDFVEIYRA